MTKTPKYWNKAVRYLSKKDRILKGLIIKYNDKILTTRKDIFFSLCKYNRSTNKCSSSKLCIQKI